MSVESATYISDLSPINPVHTDGLNQTDSHLRLLKSTLQATFPAVTGAVTASHTDLNSTTGLTAALGLRVRNDIAQTITGPLTVGSGSTLSNTGINAVGIQKNGYELVPTGIIAMWSGLTTNVPAGWHLCDGTSGTPNLIGMFIVGAGPAGGSGPVAGQTGGQNIQTVATSTIGPHSHGGATAAVGAHSHTGAVGGYALVEADIPPHTHTISDPGHIHSVGQGLQTLAGGAVNVGPLGGSSGLVNTNGATTGILVNYTGGGGSHTHGIVADGGHAHTINADNSHSHTVGIDVRPTYYAICLIMKL